MGISQDKACDLLQELAWARFGRKVHPNREMISKFERGEKPVSGFYRHLFSILYEVTEAELGLEPPAGHDAVGDTLELAQRFLGAKTDASAVDTVEAATYRLCRLYSTRRPTELLPRVQAQLRAGSDLLKNGVRLRDHARLLATAGWQHLLLAALHYDLGQYEAGRACREAALYIGREVGDPDIIGWSYETAAWFAIFEGVPPDVLEAAEEGARQAPEISSARVMNILKVAVGWARMGRRLEAQRAIEDAVEVSARLPAPQHPDHHFVFDPPKLDLYLSRTYAWLKMPDQAEYYARRVIAQFGSRSNDPRHVYPVPTRASMGRLDLASALLERGDLDEAARIAGQAFGPIVRHDVLRRAAEIDARLRQADPRAADVRRFHEHYIEAWRSLGRQ